ncbi:Endonuclease/exonuclease/phosphatase-like protein [Lasiosphaeria miniovina]|uniref:Endonuclease/exonuclease/phosphatase-like protein n=1 Tax=Lasiosphaeria miniovina TaxID=1954250 RepID=A0AA40DNV9_9PEZI|nr:Endonuclease/exonuclease/phosphatase-like protein [Lasiosphaeria miniovina]KAK0710150.1 Endonuclease/exonuclease/phosphatase-like protein [Lasiosphaeria miniovina]
MRPATVLASLQSLALALAAAVTIAEINGNKFLSPYSGQTITNLTGLVLAKSSSGFYMRSTTPDDDPATSEAIYVFSSTAGAALKVGDIVSLDGKVAEYRSSAAYLYLTEISSPKNVAVLSSGNPVVPLVIGKDTPPPPTAQYSSLDNGDVYGLPGGSSNVSAVNPVLQPARYGLDFWESLSGELVTVRKPTVVTRPNSYRETWVVGDWPATGRNEHGGITMTDKDSNPETIFIGAPLDGTKNPTTSKMGDQLQDITGIVQNTFGYYYLLPLTALTTTADASATPPATSLVSGGSCKALTVGDYNVENLAPTSAHLTKVAAHIVDFLKTPDLVFLQEIQDNSGATDDGVVDANTTLSTLAAAIKTLSGVAYDFTDVDPVSDQDGGAPGGNIRQAYLYRPEVLSLYKLNPGSGTEATAVVPGPALSLNPGRIDPASAAWTASRKPLAAAWLAKGAKKPFFTVNVHWSSKGGSTSLQGDARPPVNGVVDRRLLQANVTGSFIAQILALDPAARVIAAGDFNEFAFVQPMKDFASVSGLVDLDIAAKIPPTERYT